MNSRRWDIEWHAGLSVGLLEVDDDHRRFIALIKALNEGIVTRVGLPGIKARIQLILDDAGKHFDREDELFRQCEYPHADTHASIHNQLRRDGKTVMDRLGDGSFEREWIVAGLDVKDMMLDHLLTEDMRYRDYRPTGT